MSVIPKSGWEDTSFVRKNQSISVYKEEQRIKCSPNRHRLHCLKKNFFFIYLAVLGLRWSTQNLHFLMGVGGELSMWCMDSLAEACGLSY